MKELTRAEEQLMQVLWKLEKAFVKDIINRLPEPKPAYTTVSTIIRILEKKGFVGHIAYGKIHEYYPLIEKDEYKKTILKGMLSGYFGNSIRQLVSFFSREKKLTIAELEELKNAIDSEIQKQKEM